MRYASETVVPVEKSRAEIEATLIRYGATAFQSGWQPGAAMVTFRIKDLCVQFVLPMPNRDDRRYKKKSVRGYVKDMTKAQADRLYEQDVRQRWRALCLTVKAKLEAVECGISTLEREFLAFIVLPDGRLLGDWIMDNAIEAIRAGEMPLAIAGRTDKDDVIDAEVV